ncbi:MAG: hypothetical protein ACK5XA_08670 [Tagaea sp.]
MNRRGFLKAFAGGVALAALPAAAPAVTEQVLKYTVTEAPPASAGVIRGVLRMFTNLGPVEFELPPDSIRPVNGTLEYTGGALSWMVTGRVCITGYEIDVLRGDQPMFCTGRQPLLSGVHPGDSVTWCVPTALVTLE